MQKFRARGQEFVRALNEKTSTFESMMFRAALLADVNQ